MDHEQHESGTVAPESNFIANMRRRRESLGMSQSDLAAQMADLGWKTFRQATVSRLEKGDRPLRLAEAEALAQILRSNVTAMVRPAVEREIVEALDALAEDITLAASGAAVARSDFQAAKDGIKASSDFLAPGAGDSKGERAQVQAALDATAKAVEQAERIIDLSADDLAALGGDVAAVIQAQARLYSLKRGARRGDD
ncbi:MAG: helix-turn-helix domain-containing protein [Pseudoclavibacter sp.]